MKQIVATVGIVALLAGAQGAVLQGDPAKPGPFMMRVKLPDGYRIPPHHLLARGGR